MRPNLAQDPPPTEITVGGAVYPVNVDFKVWLDIRRLLRQLIPDSDAAEARRRNAEVLDEIEELAFGGVLVDETPDAVISALSDFLQGYPNAPIQGDSDGGGSHEPTFSFEYDLNYILLAIRNQSGIDLSYRRKEPFHWWEFLLEFKTLCGNHYILNLMEARGYSGKDKDLLKRKRQCALPREYTAAEQAEIDAFNALFEEVD